MSSICFSSRSRRTGHFMSGNVPRVAAKRSSRDRMEQEDPAFHERVARAFAEFSTYEWQAAHPEAGPVESVDARGATREVFARVLAVLHKRWPDIFLLL